MKKLWEFLFLVLIGLVLGFGIVFVKVAYVDKLDEQTQAQQIVQQMADKELGYNVSLDAPVSKTFEIDISSLQEFQYPVKVHNFSGQDATFSLLVYLDYKQRKELTVSFELKNNEEKLVPLHFPVQDLGDGAHALVLSLIAESNKLTSAAKEPSEFFGTAGRYTLVKKQGDAFQGAPVPAPSEVTREANGFNGVFLSPDVSNPDTFKVPPKQVTVKARQPVEFSVRMGGDPEAETYLSWMTLGWQQVPWESGEPYWFAKVPAGKFAVRTLKFTAPDKPGDYEVASFVAVEPFSMPDSAHVSRLNVNSSFRFTLHVE
ncbi:hypothetical protein JJB07_20460 [Tumebacillus sp. ITR2]|uniref:Intracellular proteinase inhibitor BsuPI domain-containing protein n=1 Tax=Tumebacillus amylolyticus TaxID=2801339 RepID=A0ABS1JFA8_9BACL|nr:hypothetical protein [Tumebacillus amylolyticus]MBL0388974.1 hypothetical protein [Tumebacillus amylolyticus]